MWKITIAIDDAIPAENALLLVPHPFDDWHGSWEQVDLKHLQSARWLRAVNAEQGAYLLSPEQTPQQTPRISCHFRPGKRKVADWIWQLQDNRYTRASNDLASQARQVTAGAGNQREAISQLIEHTAQLFGYGHPDVSFNDGMQEIPALSCGTTQGSCVDINTYIIAAARTLSIPVQYIAGYWFPPHRAQTYDMHCWLAFKADGELLFWDLAHHIKYGVTELQPGLNPAGGKRVPMSCGRGLEFTTPHGKVSFSALSEPVWVLPTGECARPRLTISLIE